MTESEREAFAKWLLSGEEPKTHEERVWWHEYKTLEGIREHAERIASLEQLLLDIRRQIGIMVPYTRQKNTTLPSWRVSIEVTQAMLDEIDGRMNALGLKVP